MRDSSPPADQVKTVPSIICADLASPEKEVLILEKLVLTMRAGANVIIRGTAFFDTENHRKNRSGI